MSVYKIDFENIESFELVHETGIISIYDKFGYLYTFKTHQLSIVEQEYLMAELQKLMLSHFK